MPEVYRRTANRTIGVGEVSKPFRIQGEKEVEIKGHSAGEFDWERWKFLWDRYQQHGSLPEHEGKEMTELEKLRLSSNPDVVLNMDEMDAARPLPEEEDVDTVTMQIKAGEVKLAGGLINGKLLTEEQIARSHIANTLATTAHEYGRRKGWQEGYEQGCKVAGVGDASNEKSSISKVYLERKRSIEILRKEIEHQKSLNRVDVASVLLKVIKEIEKEAGEEKFSDPIVSWGKIDRVQWEKLAKVPQDLSWINETVGCAFGAPPVDETTSPSSVTWSPNYIGKDGVTRREAKGRLKLGAPLPNVPLGFIVEETRARMTPDGKTLDFIIVCKEMFKVP